MDIWKGNNTIVVMFYGVLDGIPNPCLSNINCMCCDSKVTRPCTGRDFVVCHRFNLTFSTSRVFSYVGKKEKKMKIKVHKSKVTHERENTRMLQEERMYTTACQ